MSIAPQLRFMRLRIRRRCAAAFVCGLALALAFGLPARAQDQSHTLVGHRAPALALKDFQQRTMRLAQYRGKVVLLNFWASWCAPCEQEMPAFAQWQTEFHGRLQVLGVNMDDDRGKATAAAGKLKVNYPLLVGSAHIGDAYGGIYGLPVSFVIDQRGVVRAEYQGGNHVQAIHAEIARLLADSGR
jgi:cytochrome c biogenesis protein CcmG/thiol:disulfide interchange protein DsbE